MYVGVMEEDLVENLCYFLECVIFVCEEENIKMGIYFDDLFWEIFGLLRIIKNLVDLKWIFFLVDLLVNGIIFCIGFFGVDLMNDLFIMICEIGYRINFVYFCNVKYLGEYCFEEMVYFSVVGLLDMVELM